MIGVLLVLSILWLFLARALRMPAVNPVSALLVPWTIVLVMASIPGVLGTPLSQATWTIVLMGVGSVATGALLGWLVPTKAPTAQVTTTNVSNAFLGKVVRWHIGLTVALFVFGVMQAASAWPLVRQLGGLSVVFSAAGGAGGEFKHQFSQSRIEAVQSGFDSGSVVTGIVGYVLFLGHISLFTGAILWVCNRRFLALVPLAATAGYSLFSLQRTSFFMSVIIFLVAAYICNRSQIFTGYTPRRKLQSSTIAGIGAAVLAVAVLLYPLQQRNAGTSNSTGLMSIGQYIVASISGLNARVGLNDLSVRVPLSDTTGTVAPFPGYGAYTFGGIFSILQRMGVPVPRAPHSLDYYWVNLYGQSFTTNTGSSFLDFYLDFGLVGLVIASGVLGLATSICFKLSIQRRVWAIPLASFLIVSVTWSFFVNALLGDFRYIYMVVVAALFLTWLLRPNVEADKEQGAVRRQASMS